MSLKVNLLLCLKKLFTDDHAVILTFFNSSQHVDHWFLLSCCLKWYHIMVLTSLVTNDVQLLFLYLLAGHFICPLMKCLVQNSYILVNWVACLLPHIELEEFL